MNNIRFQSGWRLKPWAAGAASLHISLVLASLLLAAGPLRGADDAAANRRAGALKRLCEHLGVGKGRTIADIGCGGGVDTCTFAEIVGPGGTVFAEEIDAKKVEETLKKSHERQLPQVVPVLGHSEDPRLPNGLTDLAHMRSVFHHFAQPRQMLEHLWLDLKPGGRLVVIDQKKGPLRDWVATEERESKHHWTGETTVVRLAREAGFEFADVAEDLWYEKDPFVLVFRKPNPAESQGDPDLPRPLDTAACLRALPLPAGADARLAFIGLDRGRALLPAMRKTLGPSAHVADVVLEEWAASKEEVPEGSAESANEVLRTVNGDLPMLTGQTFQAIVFADAYHRLWDPAPLLARLRQSLRPGGFLAVLDRQGPDGEARRLAGHRRRIAPAQVRADMSQAGLTVVEELKPPTADRFLLLFKAKER